MARNIGAQAARGGRIFFFDADVTLKPDFLEKSIGELNTRNLEVSAAYVWPMSKKAIDWLYYSICNSIFFLTQTFYPYVAGSSLISTPGVHKRIHGFDKTILLGEDSDYVKRASRITRFRMLRKSVSVSVRRFEKEGRLKLGAQYLLAFFYRIFLGEIRSPFFRYSFGSYSFRAKKK